MAVGDEKSKRTHALCALRMMDWISNFLFRKFEIWVFFFFWDFDVERTRTTHVSEIGKRRNTQKKRRNKKKKETF